MVNLETGMGLHNLDIAERSGGESLRTWWTVTSTAEMVLQSRNLQDERSRSM